MTPTEANILVDKLIAAFPRHEWSDAAVELYASTIERLHVDHGNHAVKQAIATLDLAPTIRWLLDTANAEARRLGAHVDPVNPDEPFTPAAGVVARVRASLAAAGASIDARRPTNGRGIEGHWHGGPDQCPVCGGVPGRTRA